MCCSCVPMRTNPRQAVSRSHNMHCITRYHNSLEASLRAAYLRENGVMAGVIDGSVSAVVGLLGGLRSQGHFELVISSKRTLDRAIALLLEFEENPPQIDEDWEDDVQPDLSLLEQRFVPQCPSCNASLCTTRPFGPCIECSSTYNFAELVFEKFGPDALADCYESSEPLSNLSDTEVCEIPLDCPSCSYTLDGLAMSGVCPECGNGFNRRELFIDILS